MISHAWLLCLVSSALTANAMLMHNNGRSWSSRYFTQEGMLPPLLSLSAVPSNQTTTIPYSESEGGRSIPVVYTNDPSSVYKWLSNNLPYKGCTIGFDVEVSSIHSFVRSYWFRREPNDLQESVALLPSDEDCWLTRPGILTVEETQSHQAPERGLAIWACRNNRAQLYCQHTGYDVQPATLKGA
jgi:hypothetical protein